MSHVELEQVSGSDGSTFSLALGWGLAVVFGVMAWFNFREADRLDALTEQQIDKIVHLSDQLEKEQKLTSQWGSWLFHNEGLRGISVLVYPGGGYGVRTQDNGTYWDTALPYDVPLSVYVYEDEKRRLQFRYIDPSSKAKTWLGKVGK